MTLEEMFKELKNFLKIYSNIKIWILERDKKARKAIIPLENLSNFKYYFYISKTKEICFQPYHYECLYVDDPDPEKLNQIPCTYYKVITSPGKYQIHIPIPPALQKAYQDHRLRNLLQRCICEFLKAEAVSGWKAFRKLPFTQNAKYDPPPLITVFKKIEKENNEEKFINLLELLNPLWQKYYNLYITPQPDTEENRTKTKILKSWMDFYEGDESVADIKYAVYLFSRGLSYQEVENALLKESLNIHERKKGHLTDYLRRTLQKALEYSKTTYKPPLTNSKT